MEAVRESWTDRRLDDLNGRIESGFDRVDSDLRAQRVETRTELTALRGEMRQGFDRVDARFERMEERFDERFERMDGRLDERFDALQRLLVQFAGLLVAALIGLIASQL
jgi:DNA anti-recombination protein RmuC